MIFGILLFQDLQKQLMVGILKKKRLVRVTVTTAISFLALFSQK